METMEKRGSRKRRVGVVVSDRMNKTIVVRVERTFRHPRYLKEVVTAKKFYAHDENNEAKVGDVVEIAETRPLSRLKRWRLVRVIRKGRAPKEAVEVKHDNAENQS